MASEPQQSNPLGFWLVVIAIVFFATRDGGKPDVPKPIDPVVPVAPVEPEPEPVRSFRVIFVKESGSTLTAEQTAIPGAKAIREYLNAKTTREGNQPGWREYDPHQTTAGEQPTIAALWEAVKPKLNAIPCMIVEVNGKATVVSYPANAAEALNTLQRYGGQ
jgi:hypothetical protein